MFYGNLLLGENLVLPQKNFHPCSWHFCLHNPDHPIPDYLITWFLTALFASTICVNYLSRTRGKPLSIAIHEDLLYWTELQASSVFYVKLGGSSRTNRIETYRSQLTGLVVAIPNSDCEFIRLNFTKYSLVQILLVMKGV